MAEQRVTASVGTVPGSPWPVGYLRLIFSLQPR